MRAPFPRPLLAISLLAVACVSPPDGEPRVRAAITERTGMEAAGDAALAPDREPTEDELVALALRDNAGFRAALADLGVAEADWMRAGALPPVSFSLLFPLGEKQIEYAAKLPADVLWLRPKRVAAARKDWEATAEALVQHGLDLVRDVRAACADVATARARLAAARASADDERQLAVVADKRMRAGALAPLTAGAALTRAFAGADRARGAEADARVAEARLRELAPGAPAESTLCAEGSLGAPAALGDAEDLVREALAARPDLRAAELAVEAAGARAGLARREVFQLVAVFDANGSGGDFEAGPGIDLPLPLDGGRAARAGARATLAKAGASYQAAVQRVAREVREAHARTEAAAASALAWRDERLPELEKLVHRAEAAVAGGAADRSALLEARVARGDGRAAAAEAQGAWRRARAELERAVGHRLDLARTTDPVMPTSPPPTVTP